MRAPYTGGLLLFLISSAPLLPGPAFAAPPVPEAISGFQFPLLETNVGYGFAEHTADVYSCLPPTKTSPGTKTWVYHPGRDMNAATWDGNDPSNGDRDRGTPVVAAASGQVVYVNAKSWGGIVIKHLYKSQIFYTQYGHVQNPKVSKGHNVAKGDQIAEVGKTGTDSAHLHFEVRTLSHPEPEYGAYWQVCTPSSSSRYLVLQDLSNINKWYLDPQVFVSNHPAYSPNQSPTAGFTMTAGAQSAIERQTLILSVPPGTNATVSFDGSRSHDPEDGAVSGFEWTLDGQLVSTTGAFARSVGGGMHTISLVVRDSFGAVSAVTQGTIAVQDFPVDITQRGGGVPVGISRDGSVVVFRTGAVNGGNGQLFSVPTDGMTAPIPITPSDLSVVETGSGPHFGGTKVVFVAQSPPVGCSNLGCPGDIYSVNPDGTALMQLTFDGGLSDRGFPFGGLQYVRISSDGRKIVYMPVSGNSLIVMNSDGTDRQPLILQAVGGPNRIPPSSLSSDGSHVLYGCMAPASTTFDSLCVIRTDGTDFNQIVIGTDLREGTLSGDGMTIAYAASGGDRVINSDGAFRLVRGGAGPSLTYDGAVLCYWTSTSFNVTDVFCTNTDGTNLRNVTTNPYAIESYFPSISENGALVTYFTATGPATGTFIALLRPSLGIDGASARARVQGETFTFTGFGFTPKQLVTRRVRQPGGMEILLAPMNADPTGHLPPWSFPSDCGTTPEDYLIWVIDDATGKISNTVIETVTRNPACP